MGIREVMVIVGGKSVGDVVELLGTARIRADLTYRYQAGAHGIAQAIGLARDFVGADAFCCVLGDNILRGPALADVATRVRASDPRRRHAALPRARSAALRRRRARRAAVSSGFEEKPEQPEERPHPDRRVLPAAGRVRRHRPLARPDAASSRSPTCSTTTSPTAGSSRAIYEGHWTDAGTVPSLLRAAELAREDDDRSPRPAVERPLA
jgi:glucose-1-phosphate thymidylyltransferase